MTLARSTGWCGQQVWPVSVCSNYPCCGVRDVTTRLRYFLRFVRFATIFGYDVVFTEWHRNKKVLLRENARGVSPCRTPALARRGYPRPGLEVPRSPGRTGVHPPTKTGVPPSQILSTLSPRTWDQRLGRDLGPETGVPPGVGWQTNWNYYLPPILRMRAVIKL